MYRHNIKQTVGCLSLFLGALISFAPLTGAQEPSDSNRTSRKAALTRTIDVARAKLPRSGLRGSLLLSDEFPGDAQQRRNDQPGTRQGNADRQGATVASVTPTGADPKSEAQASTGNQNHTIVVNSLSDDGPGSLRQALAVTVDGDMINITAKGTITLTSGELVINRSLTIRGPGATKLSIDGNAASRVFHITPGVTVAISDLKITNGKATGFFPANAGAGVLSDHAVLTIDHCIISGNAARFGGGILSNTNGVGTATLTLNSSIVSNNSSRLGYGGGIFSGGGLFSGDDSGDATLILNNSTISGNSAGFGGGIFNDGFSGNATATINNSTLSDNVAKWPQDRDHLIFSGGGGIYNNGDSGNATLTLLGSTVSGNISGEFFTTEEYTLTPGNGGGIYNDGLGSVRPGNAKVTLTNTTVSGNQARTNEFGGYGGGIINFASDLGSSAVTMNGGSVNNNRADQYGGGIVQLSSSGEATTTVTGSVLHGNNKGAVANFAGRSESNPDVRGHSNITLANTGVHGNSGFDAVLNSGNLQVSSCDISDNVGTGIVSLSVSGEPAFATISDSLITRNGPENGTGGGVVNYGANGRSTMTITNSTIRENHALAGGGIANQTNIQGWVTLTVDKTTVSDNHAVTAGGLLNDGLAGQSYATLTNCTISDNTAEGEDPDLTFATGGGGILNDNGQSGATESFVGTATLDLINCTISGNSTDRVGGAISNHSGASFNSAYMARVRLDSCTLSGNSAAQGGNSIWNEANTELPEPCTDDCPPPPPCPGCPPPPPPSPPGSRAIVDFANTIFDFGAPGDNFRNISPGTITSRGYNLSSDAAGGDSSTSPGGFLNAIGDIRNLSPRLGPLQDNGGPTLTHALLLGSLAIDAGNPSFDPNAFAPPLIYDQRSGPGFPRVVNGRIDIGAFESRHP